MRYMILIGLLATFALPAWADISLETAEVIQPAQMVRDSRSVTLQSRQLLQAGDTLRIGRHASAALHFAHDGIITLGEDTQLFMHSASPANLGYGEILRLQLLRGELTLEAYPASNTVAKDYRINIGPLQVRALGADLWAYANSEGEVVCLHQGAVEVTGSAGEQRLDLQGQCLQHSTGGTLQIVPGSEADLKHRLMLAEQHAVDLVAEAPPPASNEDKKAAAAAAPAPAPTVSTTPAAAPQKAAADAKHWVVVVAMAPTRKAAEAIAHKLRKKTLRSTVRETGKAPTSFSVTFGDFPTREQARQFSEKLQHKYHLKIVRVAELS